MALVKKYELFALDPPDLKNQAALVMARAAATIHEATIMNALSTGLLPKAQLKLKLKGCLDKALEQEKLLRANVSSLMHPAIFQSATDWLMNN